MVIVQITDILQF